MVFSRSGLSSSPSRFLRAGWLVCLVPGRRLMSPTVVPPPTCSRPVSGVGLGPFVMRLLCCSLPAPARRQFFALRFATVCH